MVIENEKMEPDSYAQGAYLLRGRAYKAKNEFNKSINDFQKYLELQKLYGRDYGIEPIKEEIKKMKSG